MSFQLCKHVTIFINVSKDHKKMLYKLTTKWKVYYITLSLKALVPLYKSNLFVNINFAIYTSLQSVRIIHAIIQLNRWHNLLVSSKYKHTIARIARLPYHVILIHSTMIYLGLF